MSVVDKLTNFLNGMRPLLNEQGRDIQVVEATDEKIAFLLSGFCDGCDCASRYVEGVRETVAGLFPDVKEIHFEMTNVNVAV